jgi:hypothetical protein
MDAPTHWSLSWPERPPEEAANLNPAFCAELIGRAVSEFNRARRTPLNIATAFVVLPLILHKPTRDRLPGRANAVFATWVAEHNSLLAELPDRVNRLRPVSREALLFGLRHRLLSVQDGELVPGEHSIRGTTKTTPSTDDVDAARKAANLVGRWFANQGTQTGVLQGIGIAP